MCARADTLPSRSLPTVADELSRSITEEQSPQRLHMAREKLYELLTNCIPAEIIMTVRPVQQSASHPGTLTLLRLCVVCATCVQNLVAGLIKRTDDSLRFQIVKWAAFYEHRMVSGSKPIFHLEAFVARFMAMYKRWVTL
jgi:replication factor C subunit 3/5